MTINIVRHFRNFRGSRRRSMRPVINTYKQVQLHAPASVPAGKVAYTLSIGVDNYTGPGATNSEVPTGARIESITILGAVVNLVAIAAFNALTIQNLHTSQATVDPLAVGGNAQRNQVHKTSYKMIGQNQNSNVSFVFRVPPKFQRVREGDKWMLVLNVNQITTQSFYVIYKFSR